MAASRRDRCLCTAVIVIQEGKEWHDEEIGQKEDVGEPQRVSVANFQQRNH